VRPGAGWSERFVQVNEVEQRTGAKVAHADAYAVPEATSIWFTLSHVWCFYGVDDKVVDVLWSYSGD
jgi:hypothetical protein